MLVVAAAMAGPGCAVQPGDDVAVDEANTVKACDIAHKTQYDGSKHANLNCGMTSAAMFRAVTTCGKCNFSGGKVRTFYMTENHSGIDTGRGSNTFELNTLLSHFAKYDDCPNYPVTYKRWSKTEFTTKLENGYSAVVHGRNDHNPRRCSTFGNAAWMAAHADAPSPAARIPGHSIFVHEAVAGKFTVYDPDCKNDGTDGPLVGSTDRHAGRVWTAAELEHFSEGFASTTSGILASVGRGVADTTPPPPPDPISGDVGDPGHDEYWSTIRYPDLNGDGVSDICGRASGGLYCGLSQPSVSHFSAPTYWTTEFSNAKGWTDPSFFQTLQYADLNGDGKDDVCGRGAAGMICALSTGTSFGTPKLWGHFSDASGWGDFDYYYATVKLVDVNGDGKADVCGRGAPGIFCALSTGSTFGAASVYTTSFSDAGNWNDREAYWKTVQYGDVNGDGKADVCGRAAAGLICELSNGASFGSRITTGLFSNAGSWGSQDYYWETIRLVDVNGDRKADVCGRGASGISCALSSGTAFAASKLWTTAFSDAANWNDDDSYWKTIQFGDLNGDGKMDVCGRGAAGVHCGLSNGTSFPSVSTWTTAYSNAAGWDAHPSYWGTLTLVKSMDGFTGDDLCGRAANGIFCAGSSGAGFYAPDYWTTSYSNAAGWK